MRVLLVIALLLVSAIGSADALDAEGMRREMHTYFQAEKNEGFYFGGAGLASAALGGVLVSRSDPFARGVAYATFPFAAIELGTALVVYLRTGPQLARLDAQLVSTPALLRERELRRMRRVDLQFRLLEGVEITFLLGGLASFVGCWAFDEKIGAGASLAIAMQGATFLALDAVAHRRAGVYARALEAFDVGLAPTAGGAQLSMSGRF